MENSKDLAELGMAPPNDEILYYNERNIINGNNDLNPAYKRYRSVIFRSLKTRIIHMIDTTIKKNF
jgi:hypothetical protein